MRTGRIAIFFVPAFGPPTDSIVDASDTLPCLGASALLALIAM
jgi:hypothetical protein